MKRKLSLGVMIGSAIAMTAGMLGCTGGEGASESHTEGNLVKANSTPKGAAAHQTQSMAPAGGGGSAQSQSTAPSAQ
jgi:hypothetical protein